MIHLIASISQRETQGVTKNNFGLLQARRIQANVRARRIRATLTDDGSFRNFVVFAASRAG